MVRRKTTRTKLAPAVREIGLSKTYKALLTDVKARIQAAQYAALRAVNKELIGLYWDIGRLIDERQESEGWGKESGGDPCRRPSSGIPRRSRLLRLQPLAHEGFFRGL